MNIRPNRFWLPIHWTSWITSISQTHYVRRYWIWCFQKPLFQFSVTITWGAQRFMPWEWSKKSESAHDDQEKY